MPPAGEPGSAGPERPGGSARRPAIWKRLLADIGPLRESAAYRRLWVGQTVSTTGNMMTGVVIAVQVYALTRSSLAVGMIALAEAVPMLLLGLVGGTFADSTDRRKLVLATSSLMALVSAVLALQAALALRQLWLLYVLAAVQASLFSLDTPASRTFMPRLLRPERIPAAVALSQMSFQASLIAGPLLAGVTIAGAGAAAAYAADAVSFLLVIYAVWRLPPIPVPGGRAAPGIRSVIAGVRYVRRHPVLAGCLLLDINGMVFGMPMALFPALAHVHFGGGSRTVGLLYAAPAIGGVLGGVFSGPLSAIRRQGLAVLIAVGTWGLAIAGFGVTRTLVLAVPLLAIAGAADMINSTFRGTILQISTPDAMRGRVNSVGFVVSEVSPALGNVEAGVVAAATSPAISAISGGLLCAAGAAALGLMMPAFARYRARYQAGDEGTVPSAPSAAS